MRKLLLASYSWTTEEETYQSYEFLAIESSMKNTDQQDVQIAAHVFEEWFKKVYTESVLQTVVIRPAITAGSCYPATVEVDGKLRDVFRHSEANYLEMGGITTLAQAASLSDEQLLKFRNVGKMAVQRLRNYMARKS